MHELRLPSFSYGALVAMIYASIAASGCSPPHARTGPDPGALVGVDQIVTALAPTPSRGVRDPAGLPARGGRIAVPIRFASGSAAIEPESERQIETIARALADPRLHATRIEIEGHTDDVGAAKANLQLSERRAAAVKDALEHAAVRNDVVLLPHGYGETRPAAGFPPGSPECRTASRRVELVNLGPVSASPGAAPRLQIRTERNVGGTIAVLGPDDTLTPTDGYRMTVTPSVDAWVYVFQIDSSGKIEKLFPNPQFAPGANPVAGMRTLRIPDTANPWLALDDVAGRETIVALASHTPISDAEQRARASVVAEEPAQSERRGVLPQPQPGIAGRPPAPPSDDVFLWSLSFLHR